jgi:curli biogenesis system outer membrane secretion channel CsgG
MVASLLLFGMLFQAPPANTQPAGKPPATGSAVVSRPPQATPVTARQPDVVDPTELLKVKRIYVDSFGDDLISKEMQSMIVSALVATKSFKVTENRERADAILKGVALEKSAQEIHAYGEGTAVGGCKWFQQQLGKWNLRQWRRQRFGLLQWGLCRPPHGNQRFLAEH